LAASGIRSGFSEKVRLEIKTGVIKCDIYLGKKRSNQLQQLKKKRDNILKLKTVLKNITLANFRIRKLGSTDAISSTPSVSVVIG